MLAVSHGGQLMILSTPYGRRGFFFEVATRPELQYEVTTVQATECPRITPEFLVDLVSGLVGQELVKKSAHVRDDDGRVESQQKRNSEKQGPSGEVLDVTHETLLPQDGILTFSLKLLETPIGPDFDLPRHGFSTPISARKQRGVYRQLSPTRASPETVD